jgi:putative membrane protein
MFYLTTILASLHHIAAFTLVACLVYEWLTFRQRLTAHEARGLQRIDLWYGVSALVLLVAGVLRVVYGGKGYQFYVGNVLFWVKMALVLLTSILSIYPTIRYIRWGSIADDGMVVADTEFQRIRRLLRWQVIGVLLILVVAPAMARMFVAW